MPAGRRSMPGGAPPLTTVSPRRPASRLLCSARSLAEAAATGYSPPTPIPNPSCMMVNTGKREGRTKGTSRSSGRACRRGRERRREETSRSSAACLHASYRLEECGLRRLRHVDYSLVKIAWAEGPELAAIRMPNRSMKEEVTMLQQPGVVPLDATVPALHSASCDHDGSFQPRGQGRAGQGRAGQGRAGIWLPMHAARHPWPRQLPP